MRLRKECEHGRYDPHRQYDGSFHPEGDCPGGEFLADVVGEAWMESTGDHTLSGWWTDHPLSEGPFYLIPKVVLDAGTVR